MKNVGNKKFTSSQCDEGETTNHPSDCTMYRLCENGQWEDKSCSWLEHYDIKTNKCIYWDYQCSYDSVSKICSLLFSGEFRLLPKIMRQGKRKEPSGVKSHMTHSTISAIFGGTQNNWTSSFIAHDFFTFYSPYSLYIITYRMFTFSF